MFFVKPCPSCGKKIRFPLDRGKIRVRCVCGHAFIADPDDPALYNDGTFDLAYKKNRSINLDFSAIMEKVIQSLFNFKYRIQNFGLLPSSEQRKVIITVMIVFGILLIVIFALVFYFQRNQQYII